MKSVKEREEISCTSLRSSKSSFRKIKLLEYPYSALSLFYYLFRLSHEGILDMLTLVIIHQTHYEKSDWPRAFNQFTIAYELDMINAISAADIAFIISSSMSAWLLSPLECSQKQNGWTLRFCFWGWIMWKMYNKTIIEFGFRMISWISIITQVIIEILALSLAENGVIFRYNHLRGGDYSGRTNFQNRRLALCQCIWRGN